MGIEAFIKRKLNQTAVYWGNPVNNGYGGFSYDDPIEIKCRWEDSNQVVVEMNGEQIISRAIIYPDTDLQENGVLFLGDMEDIIESSGESSGEITPLSLSESQRPYIVRRWEKEPCLNSTSDYMRKAYLTPYISWE